MKRFMLKVRVKPKTIYTTFYPKLMDGNVADYLEGEKVILKAAPPDTIMD